MSDIDPITLEVIRNRIDVIAEEMQVTLMRSSFSPIVKEAQDASSALFRVDGELIAQATAIPIHLGCLIPSVSRLIEVFPAETMAEGDAYIMNDPYDGGTHLPDTTIVQPIFYADRVVALAATMTHNQDIGGKAPGSIPTDATDIFQEGICIPAMKFYERGKINSTLEGILVKNVRLPKVLLGDLHGQIAAGHVAIGRWRKLLDDYGCNQVDAAIITLLEQAERATRSAIEKIPSGTYRFSDYLDNDGVELDRRIEIRVAVEIDGTDICFDFTGTSPQTAGPVNAVVGATIAGAYYVIRTLADPSIPNNAGCYRMARFVLPRESVVNPRHPAPVNARALTIARVADAIAGALIKAVPKRLTGCDSGHNTMAFGGVDPETGAAFVTSEMGAGGSGARFDMDGIDVLDFGVVNCMNIPVEAFEMDSALRVESFKLRTDSGGAGRTRGGLGYEKVFVAQSGQVIATMRGERFFTQPWGIFGGHAAGSADAWVERASGAREQIVSKRVVAMDPGDRLVVRTAGGGGYGPPVERAADLVFEDLLDGKVSEAEAAATYGVVVADGAVDAARTAELRSHLATTGAVPTFDHGRHGKTESGVLKAFSNSKGAGL